MPQVHTGIFGKCVAVQDCAPPKRLTILRIHITGASGTGTSTLARAFAELTGATWLDADDFYWVPTSPPFKIKRAKDERLALLVHQIREHTNVVVSGSLIQWGHEVEDGWDLIVFLSAPTPVRIERLRAREMARYGSVDPAFLQWAERYDDADFTGRSRSLHEVWLAERSSRVLRLDAERPRSQLIVELLEASHGASLTLNPREREQAKAQAQAAIDTASRALAGGALDDAAWTKAVADALASAYLRDDDPRWQSGFDGDAQLWRDARDLILAPVHRDGTFLDVGCATGHLMECLESWAKEGGRRLLMFGLELSSALVTTARRRLPRLARQVFEGNVLDWVPPHTFTFVHTGLEYVPATRRPWLVRRLLDHVVAPHGRLIAGPVNPAELAATIDTFERAGAKPETSQRTDRNGKTRYVVWCSA